MKNRAFLAVVVSLAALVILAFPAQAFAATYYSSTNGSTYQGTTYQSSGNTYYYSGSGSNSYSSGSSGGSTYYSGGTYNSGGSYSSSGGTYYRSGNTWYYRPGSGSYRPSQPAPQPSPQPQPQPQPQPSPTPGLTADEQRMINLVNQARVNAGLAPLTVDMRLVDLARKKSQDMVANNYFSHTSPTYGDPFTMMTNAGISYRTAGENLAGAPTVDQAHSALMNSAGHRQNILNPNFNRIGVGIATGGPYGKMFTQLFIGTW